MAKKKTAAKTASAPAKTTRRRRKPAKKPDLSYISPDLRPLAKPIDELQPDPANARKHPERNLAVVEASLRKFGQQKNIVAFGAAAPYTVIAGNATMQCAGRLGWTHLAVNLFASEADAREFALADNRSAEMAEWDLPALKTMAEELADLPDVDLSDIGFDSEELDRLLAKDDESTGSTSQPSPAASSDDDTSQTSNDQTSDLPDGYSVIVQCDDEPAQLALLEKLTEEGFECRALIA